MVGRVVRGKAVRVERFVSCDYALIQKPLVRVSNCVRSGPLDHVHRFPLQDGPSIRQSSCLLPLV